MDLRTVKEDLLGGNYECEADFVKDMRLIFSNSRNYNTNKRSRVSEYIFSGGGGGGGDDGIFSGETFCV